MKIIRFEDESGSVGYGSVEGDDYTRARPLSGDFAGGFAPATAASGEGTVGVRRLLAPVLPPEILCIGLNYKSHAEEANLPVPKRPVMFVKSRNTLAAPDEPVPLPKISYKVDWEGELVIVIGRTAKNVTVDQALEHVFGYTCGLDVSARDWQFELDQQWARGKCFDAFCPLGPAVVTADAIADPGQLRIQTLVNGETMQDSTTADLIFDVAHMVSYLSQSMTLLPGAVILTGTPPGTGVGMDPPRYLRPGDVVEVKIEEIGTLRSPFVLEQ